MANPFKTGKIILAGAALIASLTVSFPAMAWIQLSDESINQAIRYGMENQNEGLSTFLGGNWREGADGTLLNIYTPFIEIARSATHRNLPSNPTEDEIVDARKKMVEDISYIYQHQQAKFSVALYGNSPGFAKEYFARLEGVGKGRSIVLYPDITRPQYAAEKEPDAKLNPYSAINTYVFKFADVAPLENMTLYLYGKGVPEITFKMRAKDIW